MALIIRAAEKAGAYILGVPELEDRYAFATWSGGKPSIPTYRDRAGDPGDRLRFSVAHELGHLVLHKSAFTGGRSVETEAHEFAAELLAPERGIRRDLMLEKVTLDRLGAPKVKWGISIQALIRRSFELGVITDRQHRYLLQQIAQPGWRKRSQPNTTSLPKNHAFSVRWQNVCMENLCISKPLPETLASLPTT